LDATGSLSGRGEQQSISITATRFRKEGGVDHLRIASSGGRKKHMTGESPYFDS